MGKGMKYAHFAKDWVELYESGLTFREIGRRYKVDAKTVNRTISPFIEKRRIDKWFAYADNWYDLYVNHAYSKSDIARKYDTNVSQVSKVLKSKGIPAERTKERKYEHLLQTWIKEYESGDSLEIIAVRHDVSRQTVLNYLNDKGIQVRTTSEAVRKMELDEHYFDELTEEKAYHLGLLYSTGTALVLHNSYAIQISAGQSKKHLLEPLMGVLRGKEEGVYVGTDAVYRVRFNSQYLYDHLKSIGFATKNKSRFPTIDTELIPSFIYGYMEGEAKMQSSSGYLFIDGSLIFLKRLKEELTKIIDKKEIILKMKRTSEQYRIEINNRETVRILKEWFLMHVNYDTFQYVPERTWLFEGVLNN